MRTTSLFFTFAAAVIAQTQPGWLMSGTGVLSNGLVVKFTTVSEPPLKSPQLEISLMGIKTGPDRVHRFIVDDATKSYFGYDVMVAPVLTDPTYYRVTILPLQLPPGGLPGLTQGSSPKIPAPQVVQTGDTIMLDVLVSGDGKQKIVDYIQVEHQRPPAVSLPAAESAASRLLIPKGFFGLLRDYSIDDGPLKFAVDGAHEIFVNGQPQSGLGLTGKSGSTMWFYFPGQGRYILSLLPPAGYGFQDAGTIWQDTIQFQGDGNRYEIRFPESLIAAGGVYRLHVLRDPTFRPGNGADQMILGGIDRLENLIKR
jgi:hypothetical protein